METIRPVVDLDADWPRLRPLFVDFLAFHANLAGVEVLLDRESATYRRLQRRIDSDEGLVVIGEANGEVRVAGEGRIEESTLKPGVMVGHFGSVIIPAGSRGSGLILPFLRWCEDWLRNRGMSRAEMNVLVANQRAMRLWNHLGFAKQGDVLRKDIGPDARLEARESSTIAIRKLGDAADAWPVLWPLIAASTDGGGRGAGSTAEERYRSRFLRAGGKKRLILVAEITGKPHGVASVHVVKNPWIFQESVGVIDEMCCASGDHQLEVFSQLCRELEAWLARKGVDSAERTCPSAETPAWLEQGYEPYLAALTKHL